MKKITLRALALLLVMALLIPNASVFAKSKKENHITCVYDKKTKTLTISGVGKVSYSDVSEENEDGWYDFAYGDVEKIVINDGITSIKRYCFSDLERLKKVELPSTLTKIGREAFKSCPSLLKITIPKNVKVIGEEAFAYTGLTSVEFEKGSKLKNIDDGAFERCDLLKKITIPQCVDVIGSHAFIECESLKKLLYHKA